jgi:hypothetical protein
VGQTFWVGFAVFHCVEKRITLSYFKLIWLFLKWRDLFFSTKVRYTYRCERVNARRVEHSQVDWSAIWYDLF